MVKQVKIYTKTGDKGETGLYGGKRIKKNSPRIEAIGTVDELNAVVGVTTAMMKDKGLRIKKELIKIQNDLFDIGAILASPSTKPSTLDATRLEQRVQALEKFIDKMTKELPELRNFILPGGGRGGAMLHHARTVCRRAERRVVKLSGKEHVPSGVLVYLNRLSDVLFTMARYANLKDKHKEILWDKRGSV